MEPHRHDTAETFKLRPVFYRRLYRALLGVVLINSVLLVALCGLTVYLSFYGFKPEHYFTTSHNGRILELKSALKPPYRQANAESPASHAQPATTTTK